MYVPFFPTFSKIKKRKIKTQNRAVIKKRVIIINIICYWFLFFLYCGE